MDLGTFTFNPPDARAVEAGITAAGYPVIVSTEGGEGPAHFSMLDPDGNTLLFDQHE